MWTKSGLKAHGIRYVVQVFGCIRIRRIRAWLNERAVAHDIQRQQLEQADHAAWLATFDVNGNYLHWSGYWQSISGWCFFEGRWMWLVRASEHPDSEWVERPDLAPALR